MVLVRKTAVETAPGQPTTFNTVPVAGGRVLFASNDDSYSLADNTCYIWRRSVWRDSGRGAKHDTESRCFCGEPASSEMVRHRDGGSTQEPWEKTDETCSK